MTKTATAVKTAPEEKEVTNQVTDLKVLKPDTDQVKETTAPPSFEQVKQGIEKRFLLVEKHNELTEQKLKLEKFQISHDSDRVSMRINDENGLNFSSSNPVAVGKLIEFCLASLTEKMKEIENQLRA